jgi:hypothetical protein
MNAYRVYDQDGESIYTEEEILKEYWEYWSMRMIQHGGLSPLITPENCIDDWIVVNWAVKVDAMESE